MIKNNKLTDNSYAELHLHLGGAINPRVLYHKLAYIEGQDQIFIEQGVHNYPDLEQYFTKPKKSLGEYLKMHTMVEKAQTMNRLEYFINRVIRAAHDFENISYLELRYCPYSRTDKCRNKSDRIKQMPAVVEAIESAVKNTVGDNKEHYNISVNQILCMHSQPAYDDDINDAILELAIEKSRSGSVCGIDIAGGENHYESRFKKIIKWYESAKANGLNTTAHVYETKESSSYLEPILEYLDRIGHGVMIPKYHKHLLKKLSGKCIEFCPTTYMKTGTINDLRELKPVLSAFDDAEVDVTICTDNSGMHMVRLQHEYENLLIHEVIDYDDVHRYRSNGFKHAFNLQSNEYQNKKIAV